ncbi:MAG TPA: hypothetical protein VEY13_13850 [Rubrobacteraceae bacterium]|nr:hypothetical protein [Rubrobacteraceae bacterium]
MARKEYEERYTHPELRERLLEEIKQADKGGEPGQWSARKAQLLTQEYEKQGGGYKDEKDESQRSLEQWTEEEWQTREGEARARREGETKRYLPKEAWESMSEEEKEETEKKKREGSRKGQQYVENTEAASEARKVASAENDNPAPPIKDYDKLNVSELKDKVKGLSEKEIEKVRSYEREHKNRKTLLENLAREIDNDS